MSSCLAAKRENGSCTLAGLRRAHGGGYAIASDPYGMTLVMR